MEYTVAIRPSWLKAIALSLPLVFVIFVAVHVPTHLFVLGTVNYCGGQDLGPHLEVIADYLFSKNPAIAAFCTLFALWYHFLASLSFARKKVVSEDENGLLYTVENAPSTPAKPKKKNLFDYRDVVLLGMLLVMLSLGQIPRSTSLEQPNKPAKVVLTEKSELKEVPAENVETQKARIAALKVLDPTAAGLAELGLLYERDSTAWMEDTQKSTETRWTSCAGPWFCFSISSLIAVILGYTSIVCYCHGWWGGTGDKPGNLLTQIVFCAIFSLISLLILSSPCRSDPIWLNDQQVVPEQIHPADLQKIVKVHEVSPQTAFRMAKLVNEEDRGGEIYAYVIWVRQGPDCLTIIKRHR